MYPCREICLLKRRAEGMALAISLSRRFYVSVCGKDIFSFPKEKRRTINIQMSSMISTTAIIIHTFSHTSA